MNEIGGKGQRTSRPHTPSYLPIDTEPSAKRGLHHRHLPPPERHRGRVGRLQTYKFLNLDVVGAERVRRRRRSGLPLLDYTASALPIRVGGDLELDLQVILDVLVGHRGRVHPLQRRLQLRSRFDGGVGN